MPRKKRDYQRVVLNLPTKTAATLEYLISIAQVARTKSDLVVQLLNDYVDDRRNTLNDQESWKKFSNKFDKQKENKVDLILSQYLDSDDDEDEDDD